MINNLDNKFIFHIDISTPIYLFDCPVKQAIIKKNILHFSNIIDYFKKDKIKITISFVGSEKEKSQSFIENNCDFDYTYDEFDQGHLTCGLINPF